MFKKITTGFVIQTFNHNGHCIEQEFEAGDEIVYENAFDEPIEEPDNETYQPFDMVQPTRNH